MQDSLKTSAVKLSQDLLWSVKLAKPYEDLLKQLSSIKNQELVNFLDTEDKKMVFWLNIYNAFIQIDLLENPDSFKNKSKFYTEKRIKISTEQLLSFDDIEHGILRRSQFKYGLGYITKWFPGSFERKFRMKIRDPRIHFALNCGALSCPPIKFYNLEDLDNQLNTSSQSYLEQETTYDSENNMLYITKLMFWFRGDFGGRKGILKFMKDHQIISSDLNPKIRYKAYDWSLLTKNFSP